MSCTCRAGQHGRLCWAVVDATASELVLIARQRWQQACGETDIRAAAGVLYRPASGPLRRVSFNRFGSPSTWPPIIGDRLSDKAVAHLVKRRARAIGLDPERYAGHSLRAGLATSAAAAGASERSIMAQTGHRSLPMVRRYIRDGELFRDNAAAKVL